MTWLMPRSAEAGSTTYRGRDRLVRATAALALAWGSAYLVWRILDTSRGAQPVMFVVLYACEVFGLLALGSFAFLAWRVPAVRRPDIGWRPTVDVFVCTYDEGLDVLGATLVGCDRITYPHTTWVLDDGRRDEVCALAERFGARYLTRTTNEHAKAGNINEALRHTSGQVLLILDADHVPQPDILDATIGYFDDPSVAIVQTPHDFGNHDSFQHFETGRHDQSMFFEVIMPGKDRHDGAFWCGSAAVILRHALEGIGGIATETVAEDFHTTIRLHGEGWHSRYHDETLVQGLAPHDLASFLLQRDRWARGNLAVLRTPENPIVADGLSFKQRLSYLSSLLAYFVPLQRLALLGVLVAMLVSGRLPLHATVWQLALFWLPWVALDLGASTLLSRGEVSLWDGSYSHAPHHRDLRPGHLRPRPPVPDVVQGHAEGRDRRRWMGGRPPAPPGPGHGHRTGLGPSGPVVGVGRTGPAARTPRGGPGGWAGLRRLGAPPLRRRSVEGEPTPPGRAATTGYRSRWPGWSRAPWCGWSTSPPEERVCWAPVLSRWERRSSSGSSSRPSTERCTGSGCASPCAPAGPRRGPGGWAGHSRR